MPEVSGIAEDSPLGQNISERATFLSAQAPGVRALPGARELVAAVKARGLAAVAASSAKQDELRTLLGIAGALDLLDSSTSGDDAEASKPDPDIVAAALRQAGAAPHEAVMIGDTPYDIEAAHRAGVDAIAFRSGGWRDEELAGAMEIYDGPADLLARLEGSRLTR